MSFIFFHNFLHASEIDSLLQRLKIEDISDSLKYRLLRDIAYLHPDLHHQAIYANQLIELAQKNNSDLWQYTGYFCLGNSYYHNSDFKNALDAYTKSSKFAKSANYGRGIGHTYMAIADVYNKQKNPDLALEYYRKSIPILQQFHTSNSNTLLVAFINIGDAFLGINQLDSALHYFNQALIVAPTQQDKDVAITLGNIGCVYAQKGDDREAEIYLDSARSILANLEDPFAISALSGFLMYMSDVYLDRLDFDNAIALSQEALGIAEQLDYRAEMRDANRKLAELYERKKDFEKAYYFRLKSDALSDSINNLKIVQQLANQRTEFEVGQKQAELDKVTAEKQTREVIIIAVGALAFVLVILAVVIYQFYQSKSKINRLLESQKSELELLNTTKDKFFSIISHDLRGPVSSFFGISRMIKFFVKNKNIDQLIEIADDIDESVERLSSLLDNLLSWAMQQQGKVPHNPSIIDLEKIANEHVGIFANMAKSKGIELSSTTPHGSTVFADKNMTDTIIRNLVNNALKFTPTCGTVTISAFADDQFTCISIKDTGLGIPEEKLISLFQLQDKKSTYGTSGEKGLGLGLQLVHEFIELNNGRIEVTSEVNQGTEFKIWLPKGT